MTQVLGAALTGAVVWNGLTWWRGLPSSSGHALLGGLVGAALAEGGTGSVNWGGFDGIKPVGVFGVAAVLTIAPLFGFGAGLVVDRALRRAARRSTRRVRGPVRAGQWIMTEGLALSHGANDAQKAVGVVALLLVAAGELQHLTAPLWVELACGFALTAGTALGGWPIVRTLGRRIISDPSHRRACEPKRVHCGPPRRVGLRRTREHDPSGRVVGGRRRWRTTSLAPCALAPRPRHAPRLAGDRSGNGRVRGHSSAALEVVDVTMKRWFLPENPDLLAMLRDQAAITVEAMARAHRLVER